MKTLIRQLLERVEAEEEDWIRQCLNLPAGQESEAISGDIMEQPEEILDAIVAEDEEAELSVELPFPGQTSA